MVTNEESPKLAAFSATVRAYCARQRAVEDLAQLKVDLQLKRTLINMMEMDFARDASRFGAGYDEAVEVNPGPVSWLRENCNMTSTAAASAVCVGDQAARLENSQDAVNAGRIGFAHLGLIASTAAALQSCGAEGRFDEARLVDKAENLSVVRFRTLCHHIRHEADRDAFLAEQVEHRNYRTLVVTRCGEDGVSIRGFFDPEGGAILRTALEPLARRSGPDDARHEGQRYADGLVELCAHALDTGSVPERANQRPQVQVTTSLETLLDMVGSPAGEMELAGVVAGSTVQRFACDSTITRVLVDARSRVVDVGRSERVVGSATRRALNVRDRGCVWPGCDRTPSWTAAHHVVHWTRGGRTDLDNLVLLCRRHHWSVHEGGWQVTRTEEGSIHTVAPLTGLIHPHAPWLADADLAGSASLQPAVAGRPFD